MDFASTPMHGPPQSPESAEWSAVGLQPQPQSQQQPSPPQPQPAAAAAASTPSLRARKRSPQEAAATAPREHSEEEEPAAAASPDHKRRKRQPVAQDNGASAAHSAAVAAAVVAPVASASAGSDQSDGAGPLGSGAQMHARNLYRSRPPDFLALARQYPFFRPFVTERGSSSGSYGTIDWQNPESLLAVTRVLLLHDFSLHFSMPLNHLCPPVPQRLNYIHWVAELIDEPTQSHSRLVDLKRRRTEVKVLDIGTGASCIFPLLGAASYGWNFVATEIDPESVDSARANVDENRLQDKVAVTDAKAVAKEGGGGGGGSETAATVWFVCVCLIGSACPDVSALPVSSRAPQIEVRHVSDRRRILRGVLRDADRFDALMCNPPFFSSLASTGVNPNRSAAATANELVCPGGEEEFVAQIIRESKQRPEQIRSNGSQTHTHCAPGTQRAARAACRPAPLTSLCALPSLRVCPPRFPSSRRASWHTTMLGRKSSLKSLLSLLHSRPVGAAVVRQCEFLQGSQARWGIAWTFEARERRRVEQRLERDQQHARRGAAQAAAAAAGAATAAAAAVTAAAASSSAVPTTAVWAPSAATAAAHAPAAPPAAPATLRSRARIDIRRTGLSAPEVRSRLLAILRAYAERNGCECATRPPAPDGFEWSVSMQQQEEQREAGSARPSAASSSSGAAPSPSPPAAAAAAAPFQTAVRLLHAPPTDWMVELEWKKPAAAGERARAQAAFTLFANSITQLCAAQFAPAAR